MQLRPRVAEFFLLIVALICPILYMLGILIEGRAILYYDFFRLGVIYFALAVSAGAATFLLFRRGRAIVQLAAGLALLTNLGSIAYAELLWRPDMQRAFAEVERRTFAEGQTGILVAPADDSPQAQEEARAIEEAIQALFAGSGLGDLIAVRPTYPILSDSQARHIGRNLGANIVIWKSSVQDRDRLQEAYNLTVLGVSSKGMAVDAVPLLLSDMTQGTFSVSMARWLGDPVDMRLAHGVVVPVAAALGFLAENEPLLAATLFENVSEYPDLPPKTQARLYSYLGACLLLHGRADLAVEPFERSNEIEPNARAWVGLASVAASNHQWDEAALAFSRAVTLDPYDASAYSGLGYVYARRRDVHNAYLSYQQAIALDPTHSVPYIFMGMLYELRADITAAQTAYQEAATRARPDKGLYAAIVSRAEEIRRNPPTPVPTATPRPIPSATPVPTSALHTVEQGDSLQAIAGEYDVSISEIVEINRLDDPNALYIGQILKIPPKGD